ncbi:hypothetical protein D0A40_20510 [Xanthomonas campestris pv. raphani]|nr:hypothetical protein D0A40_20510 [Xanthomonas campestris pv. raphani]
MAAPPHALAFAADGAHIDQIAGACCLLQSPHIHALQHCCLDTDVPPILSSASVWSPIPYPEEIGREETFY